MHREVNELGLAQRDSSTRHSLDKRGCVSLDEGVLMGKYTSGLLGVVLLACGGPQEAPEVTEDEESTPEAAEAEPEVEPSTEEAVADPHALPTTIDGLVERFDGNFGLWLNGLTPTVELPETASAQAVLEEMFKLISFDNGPVTEFEVLEERTVRIDADAYTALRINSNQGPKIVLIRYRTSDWWTRVYTGQTP